MTLLFRRQYGPETYEIVSFFSRIARVSHTMTKVLATSREKTCLEIRKSTGIAADGKAFATATARVGVIKRSGCSSLIFAYGNRSERNASGIYKTGPEAKNTFDRRITYVYTIEIVNTPGPYTSRR